MAIKLKDNYSTKEYRDFVVKYNAELGLQVVSISKDDKIEVYALEHGEILNAKGEIEKSEETEQNFLSELKKFKLQENIEICNQKRNNIEFTIKIRNKNCVFDTSEKTENDLIKAKIIADKNSWFEHWITNNYLDIDLNSNDIINILGEINNLVTPLYQIQKKFADAINHAKTVKILESIKIDYDNMKINTVFVKRA